MKRKKRPFKNDRTDGRLGERPDERRHQRPAGQSAEWLAEWFADRTDAGRRRPPSDKKMRILAAAVDLFAEKGYAAASTADIARRAGVAEGTIFRHFRSKKELLFATVGPLAARLAPIALDELAPVFEQPHEQFEQFVRAMLANRVAFAKRYAPVIRILLQEIPFHPDLRERFRDTAIRPLLERLTPVILHYQKTGQIAPMPPSVAIRLMASAAIGYLLTRHVLAESDERAGTPAAGTRRGATSTETPPDPEFEATVRFIVRGLAPDTGRYEEDDSSSLQNFPTSGESADK